MVNIQVRVDKHLRDQAQQILSQMGMDMTTAVRLFLHQLTVDKGLPFRPTIDPFLMKQIFGIWSAPSPKPRPGKTLNNISFWMFNHVAG